MQAATHDFHAVDGIKHAGMLDLLPWLHACCKAAQALKYDPLLAAHWLAKHRAASAMRLAATQQCAQEAVMLSLLRTCGLSPSALDDRGVPPLHHAAAAGHAAVIQLLWWVCSLLWCRCPLI